jgi:NADPH:quinone reductase-like Zn-dependent oxidoreductase
VPHVKADLSSIVKKRCAFLCLTVFYVHSPWCTFASLSLIMPEPSASGKTWLVVGASRGIGHEFVRQLMKDENHVLATVRNPTSVAQWNEKDGESERCRLFKCDVLDDSSINVR